MSNEVLQFVNQTITSKCVEKTNLKVMFGTTAGMLTRTVLIVEDADTCAELLEVALIRIPGVDIACVASGHEALQLLAACGGRVCAMVTDLNMPRGDGFELIGRVRSDMRYAGLPIIVVSGDIDPRTPERVKGLGVNAFFPKPYSPASVRQTLENLLNERGGRETCQT
jgi:CheY-like chemotaxis protein